MKTRSRRFLFGTASLVLLGLAILAARKPGDPVPAATAGIPPAKAEETQGTDRRRPGNPSGKLLGMRISPGDPEGSRKWARSLSRNEDEYTQRLSDLKHVKRAEVIRFSCIADNKERLSTDQLPLVLSLPSFDGAAMDVAFDHLSIDGPEGGTLAGRVVGRPDTSVVLGFHNGETSGLIEGPDLLVFLDAFDGETVILREVDSAAHAEDFDCDCLLHKAAAARAEETRNP